MHGEVRHGELQGDAAWVVEANADVMLRLKRIFPRVETTPRGWILLYDTPEVCRDLEWALGRWPMRMSGQDRALLESRAAEHRQREETVQEILSGQRPHFDFIEPARPAREYQLTAADLAVANGELLLADDLGLGKTMSGLLVLRSPAALPALVVCPTHLPRQWQDELAKTLPWLRAHIIRSMRVYDPAARRDMRGHDPDVLILPYSKLRGWGYHLAGKVRTVIFDEAQELRRSESDKWKAAAHVASKADIRVGLTATPVYNYGGEIFNVLSVLAPDRLGSRGEFVREWCGGGLWGPKTKVEDPAALGTFLRKSGLMLRRTRSEVGRELPEIVRVPHTVDTDPATLERLTEDAVGLARMIVEKSGSREEIWKAGGDLDWKMRHATGVAKAPYVAGFVRMLLETDEKVVLFGWHRDVYEIWAQELREFDPCFYTGTESAAQKQAARDRFVHGDSRLFIMSLRAGAGLDGLQEASHVAVFGELDWSPGMHDQCIGRLHRDGQGDHVVAYFLIADEGADPVIAEALSLKRASSDPIIDPDAKLFSDVGDPGDRVKRLAETVLAGEPRRKAAA